MPVVEVNNHIEPNEQKIPWQRNDINHRRIVIIFENDIIGDGLWFPYIEHHLRYLAAKLEKEKAGGLVEQRYETSDGTTMTLLCNSFFHGGDTECLGI